MLSACERHGKGRGGGNQGKEAEGTNRGNGVKGYGARKKAETKEWRKKGRGHRSRVQRPHKARHARSGGFPEASPGAVDCSLQSTSSKAVDQAL